MKSVTESFITPGFWNQSADNTTPPWMFMILDLYKKGPHFCDLAGRDLKSYFSGKL